jgi:hypothetical protein
MLYKRLERENYRSATVPVAMDYASTIPTLPAEYYRRHAARVRQLASEATTAAVKERLREVALEYERLAARVDSSTPTDP